MRNFNSLSICAVIVSYEPDSSLIRLYESIKNQVDEIVVIDNNSSSKNSVEILRNLEKNITIIFNKKNLGVAAALNQGVKFAINKNYSWVLTLDQDSEFLQNTYNLLQKSYENLKDKDKVMIIAPKPIERIFFEKKYEVLPDYENILWKDVVLNLTSGSLIKTEVFNEVGFFDDKLFIEQVDNDFCYKLIKKSYKIKVADNVNFIQEIGHAKIKGIFVVRNHLPERKYYLSRNVTIMIKKYFFVAPLTTMRYFLGGTILGWTKILFFEKQKFLKIINGFKGFFDGIFGIYRNKE